MDDRTAQDWLSAQDLAWLTDHFAPAWQQPFRGKIWEYASEINLQAGYAVRGQFDINTARHLIEPLEAIGDPAVRIVTILGAVQTLKSLVCDIVVPYWIEHDPGDILWLFEDDPKAKLYADTRAMPMIRSKPSIYRMLQDVDRHEKTKTRIRFAHCNLVLAGLNEGNVQSISYRYVIIDEAWMARANGLIFEGIDRTKQYSETKKVIILGQGGWEDEDFDLQHKKSDMRDLTYACPFCGFRQPFDLSRRRGPDFPKKELRDTFSGLSWDTNEVTRPGGKWNFNEVSRSAHHRCYKCNARIEDRPEVRRQLCESYKYVVTNPGAVPGHVGFHWPSEASPRLSFGGLACKYLEAKTLKDELGYELKLQQFYQKDRAEHWSNSTGVEYRSVTAEPYDVHSDWPEEALRFLIVDCQRDLKKFYASVFAVSLAGEARELARATLESFGAIATLQQEWKVADQRVFLDCGYQQTQVLRECVRRGHVGTIKAGGKSRKVWLCWTGLKGSGLELFKHSHPKKPELKEWKLYSERKFYDVNLGTAGKSPRAPWYEWANLGCKDMLRARRDAEPGMPILRLLPDTLPQTDPWSHFCQLRSEKRSEKYEGGKKKAIWELIREGRPNHEWDKLAMLMAVMCIAGVIAAEATPEPQREAA